MLTSLPPSKASVSLAHLQCVYGLGRICREIGEREKVFSYQQPGFGRAKVSVPLSGKGSCPKVWVFVQVCSCSQHLSLLSCNFTVLLLVFHRPAFALRGEGSQEQIYPGLVGLSSTC